MTSPFLARHLGLSDADRATMLKSLNSESLDALMQSVIPADIYTPLDDAKAAELPGVSEPDMAALQHQAAAKNTLKRSLLGEGYADTITPAVIQRNVLENPGWYTAYTPYQAEIAQGRLEALLNFQTMVGELTEMPVVNASLLDEATAAAEAMLLAHRVNRRDTERFFIDNNAHQAVIAVVKARARHIGVEVVVDVPSNWEGEGFGGLLAYPNTEGAVTPIAERIQWLQAQKALAVVACDILALAVLPSPGSMNADIVIGNAQRFGVPLGFGGPHAAFIASQDALKRQLPGRIIGVSRDRYGKEALRIALQTREQHIKRDKATSNICTAQALLAMMSGFYALYHGADGIKAIAARVHGFARTLAEKASAMGYAPVHATFFDTVLLNVGADDADIIKVAAEHGYNLANPNAGHIRITLDEKTTDAEITEVLGVLARFASGQAVPFTYAAPPARDGTCLQHPVFDRYRSETEMMRYMRKLMDRDLALDRTMIPLGSCTMKLNAASEMQPLSWPAFSDIHPYAPVAQAAGYLEVIDDLAKHLCALTGFARISFQPNSGSQGEYAGLLAIKAYHESRGDTERNICLVPASAHGTNPASAKMAGMDIVVLAADENGNIDLADVDAKIAEHGERIAALMVTYPSTHGVFEATIVALCDKVHAAGGQVYMDGANLNAQIGLCLPGQKFADVSHMNLHKTFAIPHGGGGPGVGPIGVREHLAPFLPGHLLEVEPERTGDQVAGSPWGSASILLISWSYVRLLGYEGLMQASKDAILSANYIAERLHPYFPVLYRGAEGRVAHECLMDFRPITKQYGVTVEDIAKRLMDYGFHAPTVSFPVAGTMMIEPTESESLAEMERFCEAMIAIHAEIEKYGDAADSPLKMAPHTAEDMVESEWTRPYSRREAILPHGDKYWPAVNRIDSALGDRNLICQCLPVEAYK